MNDLSVIGTEELRRLIVLWRKYVTRSTECFHLTDLKKAIGMELKHAKAEKKLGFPISDSLITEMKGELIYIGKILSRIERTAKLQKFLELRGFDPLGYPVDWEKWTKEQLEQFPITRAILEFKKGETKK